MSSIQHCLVLITKSGARDNTYTVHKRKSSSAHCHGTHVGGRGGEYSDGLAASMQWQSNKMNTEIGFGGWP